MTTRDYAKQILEDINGRSGMDTGAYDDDTINDMLEAWSKVIAEARREAIEECAKIADRYVVMSPYAWCIGVEIRATVKP